jgi:hypothetical protein
MVAWERRHLACPPRKELTAFQLACYQSAGRDA